MEKRHIIQTDDGDNETDVAIHRQRPAETSETGDNLAFFTILRAPHERIQIGEIVHRLREIGKRLKIPQSASA